VSAGFGVDRDGDLRAEGALRIRHDGTESHRRGVQHERELFSRGEVVDVPQALEARHFAADGTLVLKVTDGLGLTAGTFSLKVQGGTARVTASDEVPDLELDIAALSSIYLGAVNPVSLAAAGTVHENTAGAAFLAARLFAVERPAHCLTHF
jgi:predicted acetyltransferase